MSAVTQPVVIGFAGPCCATRLRDRGVSSLTLEAPDDIGGRARTDRRETASTHGAMRSGRRAAEALLEDHG
jgi:predicted NAD/FAD-dependent oxidoreductase